MNASPPKGNTAVYMLYAYTRISSISRKANLSAEAIEEARQEQDFVCRALGSVPRTVFQC